MRRQLGSEVSRGFTRLNRSIEDFPVDSKYRTTLSERIGILRVWLRDRIETRLYQSVLVSSEYGYEIGSKRGLSLIQ